MTSAAVIGRKGEEMGVSYLRTLGYRIRERNFRAGRDEIDIIAEDPADQVIVFVEVKTRSRGHPDYSPLLSVGRRKRTALARAMRFWIDRNGYDGGFRLDVLCLENGRVTAHIREIGTG